MTKLKTYITPHIDVMDFDDFDVVCGESCSGSDGDDVTNNSLTLSIPDDEFA